MRVFKKIEPLKNYLTETRTEAKKVGFVPTMGALHEGHLSLIRQARAENDLTVCSIYINPTQFNNEEDLVKYPRTLDADITLLTEAGCDVVFCPSDEIMYPQGKNNSITLDFGSLTQTLEGAFRPGHFSGVGVILSKLFHIIAPHRAYFGQKDLQQLAVVRKLVHDLFFDLEIVRVPTLRNHNGLALSSRNSRLSEHEKVVAARLFQTLRMTERLLLSGESTTEEAVAKGLAFLQQEEHIVPEYLAVVDARSFESVTDIHAHPEVAVCIVAYVGGVRLIDNLIVGAQP